MADRFSNEHETEISTRCVRTALHVALYQQRGDKHGTSQTTGNQTCNITPMYPCSTWQTRIPRSTVNDNDKTLIAADTSSSKTIVLMSVTEVVCDNCYTW